jgi:excisionase family DNA binding protein
MADLVDHPGHVDQADHEESDVTNAADHLDAQRIAARLGVSRRTVYRLLEAGEIAATKVGEQWRTDEQAVSAYLSRRSNQPIPA